MNYNLHKRASAPLLTRYAALVRLTRYFENAWLNEPFPVQMWNVFDRHPRLRTTNTVEVDETVVLDG